MISLISYKIFPMISKTFQITQAITTRKATQLFKKLFLYCFISIIRSLKIYKFFLIHSKPKKIIESILTFYWA